MSTSLLELNDVTLIALTGKDFDAHREALDKSSEFIEWGAVKLIKRYDLNSIDKWNYAMVYELHQYVNTPYAMVIHADGYVINPHMWHPIFKEYDYVGAPWPLPRDEYSYRTPEGELIRVGNSVSLRSKRIMELPSKLNLQWRSYHGNTNEDGFLCVHNRKVLEQYGCKFAPLEVAKYFSKEHEIPENIGIETFAFHQVDL